MKQRPPSLKSVDAEYYRAGVLDDMWGVVSLPLTGEL